MLRPLETAGNVMPVTAALSIRTKAVSDSLTASSSRSGGAKDVPPSTVNFPKWGACGAR